MPRQPPPASKPQLNPIKETRHQTKTTHDSEGPAEADAVDHFLEDGDEDCREDAAHDVGGGLGCRGHVLVYVY